MNLARMSSRSQTLYLGLAVGFGYVCFVAWLGLRLIVLGIGGVVTIATIAFWLWQIRRDRSMAVPSTDLLQAEVFLKPLIALDAQVPAEMRSTWQVAQQQTEAIHQAATQIAQYEPTLIPDLLETLHTVLALLANLVQTLQVSQQVQTPQYQVLGQQQLERNQLQLQTTHQQLQELRDQIAIEQLEQRTVTASALSSKLQTLISENTSLLISTQRRV